MRLTILKSAVFFESGHMKSSKLFLMFTVTKLANTFLNCQCFFHRHQKSLNRLLKVCYVPATSAVLIAFFSSFFLQPLTVLMKQTRQLVRAVKQSIYLDVYGFFAQVLLQFFYETFKKWKSHFHRILSNLHKKDLRYF